MSKIRVLVSDLFETRMGDMTFTEYFRMLNGAGKITTRSTTDLIVVMLDYLYQQEVKQLETEKPTN